MMSDIERMLNDSKSLYENIKSNIEIWREKVNGRKLFKENWQEFLLSARKLIKKTTKIEENFFPKTTDEFGSSLEIAQSYQKSLEEFMPTVKTITNEIDDYITKAEILSLDGDTHGQKELIILELTKIRQRFLTRVNEYKTLLQMAIRFFQNFHKVNYLTYKSRKIYLK
jgi:hypothetical protein